MVGTAPIADLVGTSTRPRGAGGPSGKSLQGCCAAAAAAVPSPMAAAAAASTCWLPPAAAAAGAPMMRAARVSRYARVLPEPGCATASTSLRFGSATSHTLCVIRPTIAQLPT